ncbi:MAG: TetR/AcrR family transcriptional regulator [Cyanobacteria bacterium P01_F01_bin.3]
MARPPLTEKQKAKMKGDIRRAALRLKDKRESEPITVRAVAAEAGVSVGTFYSYYGSLAELTQSTWKEPVDELRRKIERLAEKTSDPVIRIQKVLECYARFEKEKRLAFKSAFLFVRQPYMSEPIKEPIKNEAFFIILRDSIEEGQAAGVIREGDSTEMAQLLWSAIHGALALPYHLDRYNFYPSQKLAKKMATFLVESISN